MKKNVILFFIAIVVGLILSLALLEIYLRFMHRSGLQVFNCQEQQWRNQEIELGINGLSMALRLSNDPLVAFEFDPKRTDINHYGYHIDQFGFFNKEYKVQRDENVYRIAFVGDSIIERRWSTLALEQLLNEAKLTYKFEVWNCAIVGYNMINYYGILKSKILKMNPNMIIIGFCLNDLRSQPIIFKDTKTGKWVFLKMEGQKNFTYFNIPFNSRWFIRSYAYRFLVILLQNFKEDHLNQNADECVIAKWALGNIVHIAENKKIKLLGVIIPYFKSRYNDQEMQDYLHLKSMLDEYEVRYIDLKDKFPDLDDLSWRLNAREDDFTHPSEKGHMVIANQIYNCLLNNEQWWYVEK